MGRIPHVMIMIVNKINGEQALIIWPAVYFFSTSMVGTGSLGNLQIFFGFQNFKKMTRHKIEQIPASTSGRAGPRKFEVNHCITAKEIPDTNMAGNNSLVFFNPALRITREKGSITYKKGSVLPTIFEITTFRMDVSCEATVIGIPTA